MASPTTTPAPRTLAARMRGWFMRSPFIPVVRLSGVIGSIPLRGGGLTITELAEPLERAFTVKRAPAVALVINSPGGSPVQSSLIARRIRMLAEEHEKPVFAFVEDVAASGGYWLALAADEIIVDPASIVGSIGVISQGFGFQDAIARLGIERRVHTAGKNKGLLDPFQPERTEDLELLKEIQGDIHSLFKEWVKTRRKDRLKADDDTLFNGRIWAGERAVELGLVDQTGELRAFLAERYGKDVRPRVVNRARSWLARRLGMTGAATTGSGFAETGAAAVREIAFLAEEAWWRRRAGL